MDITTSLNDRELELLRRRCRGAALGCQPAGFNHKAFLVRLLKDHEPALAAKLKRLAAGEVEALCAEVAGERAGPVVGRTAFEMLLA
jgi:hypothetical protein